MSLDINSVAGAIASQRLVLEAKYRAYTPWLGGCAWNATVKVADGRVVDVCLPDSKGLIGRARWLGRIAVATAIGRNIAMSEAEKPVARALGSTSEASSVRVVVEPLQNRRSLVQKLDRVVQRAARRLGGGQVRVQDALSRIVEEIAGEFRDPAFRAVSRNARLGLLAMGRAPAKEAVAKAAARTPLPPPLAGFRLKVYARVDPGDARVRAAAALLAATPLLAGLGAAASRGFGRFCLESYNERLGLQGLLDKLKCGSLAGMQPGNAMSLVKSLHRNLGNLLLQVSQADSGKQGHTPVLDDSLSTVVSVGGSVYEVLKKIGEAVTKQCWKGVAGFRPTAPGANLHTWPLGLPRQQKTGGYTVDLSGEDERCKERILGEAGRRLSMIHLYPLPPAGNQVNIVVAVYRARDLEELLDSPSPERKTLYHVGRYIVGYQQRRGRRVPQFGDYHHVSVNRIASTLGDISDPCDTGHRERGGIRGPRSTEKATSPEEILDYALRFARNFVVECLRRGGGRW